MELDIWMIEGIYNASKDLGLFLLESGTALLVGLMIGYALSKARTTKRLS